jgi:hypothetical protein
VKQSLCSYVEAVTGLDPTCKQKEIVKYHGVTAVQALRPARFENCAKIIHPGKQEQKDEECRSTLVPSDSMEIVVVL